MNENTQKDPSPEDQSEETISPAPGDRPLETLPARKFKLTWEFVTGFLGWYLAMGLVFWMLLGNTFNPSHPDAEGAMIVNGLCIFPIQIATLAILLLVKNLRNIGWGMLSAIGVNFVISLILGLVSNPICFIPFFAPILD